MAALRGEHILNIPRTLYAMNNDLAVALDTLDVAP